MDAISVTTDLEILSVNLSNSNKLYHNNNQYFDNNIKPLTNTIQLSSRPHSADPSLRSLNSLNSIPYSNNSINRFNHQSNNNKNVDKSIVYERMYNDAFRIKNKINKTRILLEKQRLDNIKKNSFIESVKYKRKSYNFQDIRQGDDCFEKLYNYGMSWIDKRDKNIEKQRLENLKLKQDLEKSSITSSPHLFTSPKLRQSLTPNRPTNRNDLFLSLYNDKDKYFNRSINNFVSNESFTPKIDEYSRKLANRKRSNSISSYSNTRDQILTNSSNINNSVEKKLAIKSPCNSTINRCKSPDIIKRISYSWGKKRILTTPNSESSTNTTNQSKDLNTSIDSQISNNPFDIYVNENGEIINKNDSYIKKLLSDVKPNISTNLRITIDDITAYNSLSNSLTNLPTVPPHISTNRSNSPVRYIKPTKTSTLRSMNNQLKYSNYITSSDLQTKDLIDKKVDSNTNYNNVFDNLYHQGMKTQSKHRQSQPSTPLYNHKPDIGISTNCIIEPDKELFYKRLHDENNIKSNKLNDLQDRYLDMERGYDINPPIYLSADYTDELTDRLSKKELDYRLLKNKSKLLMEYASPKDFEPRTLLSDSSNRLAKKSRRRSLNQIFDVLVASVDYAKSKTIDSNVDSQVSSKLDSKLDDETSSPLDSEIDSRVDSKDDNDLGRRLDRLIDKIAKKDSKLTTSQLGKSIDKPIDKQVDQSVDNNIISIDEQEDHEIYLDVKLAQINLIEPALLSDALTTVLINYTSRYITKQQFIELIEDAMTNGRIPPIGTLLTQPAISERRHIESYNEKIDKEMLDKPMLIAKRKNEKLLENRYTNDQPVEDRLIGYREYYNKRKESSYQEQEKQLDSECSFHPTVPQLPTFYKTQRDRSNNNAEQIDSYIGSELDSQIDSEINSEINNCKIDKDKRLYISDLIT